MKPKAIHPINGIPESSTRKIILPIPQFKIGKEQDNHEISRPSPHHDSEGTSSSFKENKKQTLL